MRILKKKEKNCNNCYKAHQISLIMHTDFTAWAQWKENIHYLWFVVDIHKPEPWQCKPWTRYCLLTEKQCSSKASTTITLPMDVTIKHRSPPPNFPPRAVRMLDDDNDIIVPISAIPEFSQRRNEASSTFNNKVCIFSYPPPSPSGPKGKLDFTLVLKRII